MRGITKAAMLLGLAWLLVAVCGFGEAAGGEGTVRIGSEPQVQAKIHKGTIPGIVVSRIEGGTTPGIWINSRVLRREAYSEPRYQDLLLRIDPSRMWQNPWKKETLPEPWVQDLFLRRIVPGVSVDAVE